MIEIPKVFVAYSWESEENKKWVLEFSTRLRKDGINIILDYWETSLGDDLAQFMEVSIRESDFVLVICTPEYKKRSDNRSGGVGYEGAIITSELFTQENHRKFIPLLRSGNWNSSSPSWALGKFYIDLRGKTYDEDNYEILLATLLGVRPEAPEIGKTPPSFADQFLNNHPKEPESLDEVRIARKGFEVEVLYFDASQKFGNEFPYSDFVRLRITNGSNCILPHLTLLTTRFNKSGKRVGSSRNPSIPISNLKPGESFETDYYPLGHLPYVGKITVEIEHLLNDESLRFIKEFEPFL